MATLSALNVAVKIEVGIRVRVFLVSLYRRLLSHSILVSFSVAIVALSSPIYSSRRDVCGIRTPSTVRISLSLFLPPCSFHPVSRVLDPANDSWKNNSENERATTVERWAESRERRRKRETVTGFGYAVRRMTR